jgi:aspartate aminotransferase-like enzyme
MFQRSAGKDAIALQVEWGQPIRGEQIREQLKAGGFDAVTVIHNETSTGVMSPIAEIAEVMRDFPEVLLIVDSVSSFSVVPLPMDELGIDVLLTGSQKALAMPPGLALFSASEKAFVRAETVKGRGYYFDFLEFQKKPGRRHDAEHSDHFADLRAPLEAGGYLQRGVAARHARHAELNGMVAEWVKANGFEFFAPEGYRSKSLTCVRTTEHRCARAAEEPQGAARYPDRRRLRQAEGETFRLSNMGRRDAGDDHRLARRARRFAPGLNREKAEK